MTNRLSLPLVLFLAACGDNGQTTPPVDAAAPDSPVDAAPELLTAAEVTAAHQLSPLPAVPADTTNAYANSAGAVRLGQMLFFDKSYSGPLVVGDDGTNGGMGAVGAAGKVSCHSCHTVGSSDLDDRRSTPNNVSLGTDFGPRNALGLINASFYKWTNWGGRFDSQWSLPIAVAENAKIMKSSRLQLAHMLYDKYRAEYDAVFPVPLDARLADTTVFAATGKIGDAAYDGLALADKQIIERILANYGKAVAAYMRTLVSRNAPFDRFVAGDRTAISPAAVRGFKTFLAKACVTCHSGPSFSDDKFHVLGVPQTGLHVPATDLGRNQDVGPLLASPFNVDGVYSDDRATGKLTGLIVDNTQKGQFRTKGLRNVAQAGPFMHAGQLATLADVVGFYKAGGGDVTTSGFVKDPLITPLTLTAQDTTDLVEFLGTLTGDPPPVATMVDISK